ncbi:OS9 endoplasmic reticulum lectin [Phyllostomus discolor]|uniref:Endoplasmic reticulum lectin n=2 Tax=Phyllostomus discolor TaxID=89673 RepID=A0A6J2N7Q2_9CHIR|nr:protein OS-9 isoform X2 [Phyllostomus discolor]KAF6120757.1 OS9 endoplasmic reticulum lectin [Phyllostomus discolor]
MAAEQLLSSLLGLLFLGLLLPAALTGGVGSLNLEELSEMRYGIEILPLPVMGGQSQASDVVIVSSKYKQRYECRLPAGAIHFQREREEETPAYQGPGIPELLSPMKDAPCLLKTKDWWTYEFCYGRHIQQYHMEDSEIKGEVLYLGYYQSAFDWDDETAKASKQHRLKRYHSQTYGNGSKCDLNGRPREAEVRFLCDEGAGISGDYIDRVDEPLSCSYVLTVRTPRLCPHPLLRPPPSAAPQAILCHPALQPEEYLAYLQRQADSKQYEDKMIEELHDLDPPVWSETAPGVAPTKRAAASPAKDDSKEPDFWKMMIHEPEDQVQGREEAQAEEQEPNLEPADPAPGSPDDFQSNVQVKVIRSPADLIRLIEELKGGTKKGKPNAGQEQPTDGAAEAPPSEPEVKAKGDTEHQQEVEEEEDDEDEDEDEDERQLLGEFEKELEGILLPSDRERLRSEVKAGMERELENIIQETEKELDPDGLKKESERDRAMLALTSTLNKLIKRLEEKQSPELVKKHRRRRVVPRKPPPSLRPAEEDPEHRVRVRVTKLRHGGPNQDLTVLEMKRENPQLKQIEGLVKELLEREGLTAEGKIEIKIVRPGAEGTEEDARWLTDEDTKNLKEIFFNILVQGAEEAQKERQRQKELESNYRRVWGSGGGEGTGDLDEFDF